MLTLAVDTHIDKYYHYLENYRSSMIIHIHLLALTRRQPSSEHLADAHVSRLSTLLLLLDQATDLIGFSWLTSTIAGWPLLWHHQGRLVSLVTF